MATTSPKNQDVRNALEGKTSSPSEAGCKTCEFAKKIDGQMFELEALQKSGEAGCDLCSFLYEAIHVYVDEVECEKLEAYPISDPVGAIHIVAKDYDNTLHRSVYLQFFVLPGMLEKYLEIFIVFREVE
jgi:hypothetical protein